MNEHAGATPTTTSSHGTEADATRFATLYREWYRPIVRVCQQYLGPDHDAEAIAQEAFIRAWSSWHQYSQERPFGPWVYSIARRLCCSEVALSKRRRGLAARGLPPVVPVEDDAFLDAVRTHGVDQALRALSPRARRLVIMRDFEGWSYDQIAGFDRSSVEAVRGALKRARAAFRAAYHDIAGAPAALGISRPSWVRQRVLSVAQGVANRLGNLEPIAAGVALLLLPTAPTGAGTTGTLDPATVAAPAPFVATAPGASVLPAPEVEVTAARTAVEEVAASLGEVAPADLAMEGSFYTFTASPAYDEDRTVFALGGKPSCEEATCAVLLKSTDGGATWTKLPAAGLAPGRILLPPAYPRDDRIFVRSVDRLDGKDGLWASADAGRTFTALAPGFGAISLSPLFSAGDPRAFLGAVDLVPVATEYRDNEGKAEPLSLPLPYSVLPADFAFGDDYVRDGTMVVSTVSRPLPSLSGGIALKAAGVYRCRLSSCERIFERPALTPFTVVRLEGDRETFLAWNRDGLHRSTDRGASFAALSSPGGSLKALRAAGGRLLASTEDGLFSSADEGSTWVPAPMPAGWTASDVDLLPDGTILLSPFPLNAPAFACSVDNGATWASACRRP